MAAVDNTWASMNKLKFLFNCTTNCVGGAVQNAVNFILEAQADSSVDWYYAVSDAVNLELSRFGQFKRLVVFSESPARSWKARRLLRTLECDIQPELVYTMAGPAYVNFRAEHVMGCSNPYVTNLDKLSLFYERSLPQVVSMVARSCYQAVSFRNANRWIFQTATSRDGFCKKLNIDRKHTCVVGNALGAAFNGFCKSETRSKKRCSVEAVRVFCPGAGYPHKALQMVPSVAKTILDNRPDINVKFTTTIEETSDIWRKIAQRAEELGVRENVVNIGPFSYVDAPRLYDDHDLVFLPSILEVFSTSYLEAIGMRKPLVVSDRPFAREICRASALYFEPLSSADAASRILEVIDSEFESNPANMNDPADNAVIVDSYHERYLSIRNFLLASQ